MKKSYLVMGNQLLIDHPAASAKKGESVIMIEAHNICAKLPYHKHKLVLIIAAMRNYRDYLIKKNINVIYVELNEKNFFINDLEEIIKKHKIEKLSWMQTSDISPNEKLVSLVDKLSIEYEITENKQFMTPVDTFKSWYESQKQPLMESFYRMQRKRTGILMDNKPVGGLWNYDAQNRKPLPKNGIDVPKLAFPIIDNRTKEAQEIIEKIFPNNPGKVDNFWLPTTHLGAVTWLEQFISERLSNFGPYEDASRINESFLFHSVLSPLLNCGLLSPEFVVDKALEAYGLGKAPINSVEGFIRQIIGWREYMYGMYINYSELKKSNYFGFTKKLENWWYDQSYLDQDLPVPIKEVLHTLHLYGYNHHIERLMVLGNWFLLNEYDPGSVLEWFSSMYVDAYEWVMIPNVLGMSQFADGGVIATKPYISGGNYLQKMGRWWSNLEEAKNSQYSHLYWQFLNNNKQLLQNNYRMSLALRQAESKLL